MKANSTIRRELARLNAAIKRTDLGDQTNHELYGARQALSWALGQNTMAPAKCALLGAPPAER